MKYQEVGRTTQEDGINHEVSNHRREDNDILDASVEAEIISNLRSRCPSGCSSH